MKSVKLEWKLMHCVERKTIYVNTRFVATIGVSDVVDVIVGLVVVI